MSATVLNHQVGSEVVQNLAERASARLTGLIQGGGAGTSSGRDGEGVVR